jgi:hypothetical protein
MRGSEAAVADESVTKEQQDQFRHLQALDDALAFRLARVAIPCPDCDKAAEGKCDDHAVDLVLIELYKRDHSIASR